MSISIKFNSDFRIFKKGTTYKVDIGEHGITWLVGNNGCGKSSFLRLLRASKDSLKSINTKIYEGIVPSELEVNNVDVSIDGLDSYDNCFYLDVVADNPLSFENSASAGSFVSGGGLEMMRLSRGQGSCKQMFTFIQKIKKIIPPTDDTSHNLIVLDEVDEGMDLNSQSSLGKNLIPMLHVMYNADVICVTHSVVPLMAADNADVVYSFDKQKFMPSREYISTLIGKPVNF